MGLSRLLLLASLLASATSSPIAQDVSENMLLPYNPGVPVIPATETTTDSKMLVNPGGPMIPVATKTVSDTRMSVNPGGPVIWATKLAKDSRLPFSPGGLMSPVTTSTSVPTSMTVNPSGPILLPSRHDSILPYKSGGPMVSASQPEPTGAPLPFQPGGPIEPLTRRDEDRVSIYEQDPDQAADLGAAKPFPTSDSACTYTTSAEAVASPCSWNGVMTDYPSTTTAYKQVDCNGCSNIHIQQDYYFCPLQAINATAQAHTPSTYWSTVCSPSATSIPQSIITRPHPSKPQTTPTSSPAPAVQTKTWTLSTRMPIPTSLMHPEPTATPMPIPVPESEARPDEMDSAIALGAREEKIKKGNNGPPCPTTYIIQPPMSAGVVLTVYRQTATTTVCLPCLGCPLVTSTAMMGYGPAGRFKTTLTLPTGYTTVYKCL